MKDKANREIINLLNQLYETSEEFIKERGVCIRTGNNRYTVSVVPLHKLEGREPNYFTMQELSTFYDNYSYKQIAEMVAASQFPMKLVSLWDYEGRTSIGFESEPDGNVLMDLSEIIEIFEADYRKYKKV